MKINHHTGTVSSNINESNHINVSDSSLKNIRGRDVIIINPYSEGDGDHALAKKIANIALDEGCRVTISSFDAFSDDNKPGATYRNYSLHNEHPHNISDLNNPLFIISPVGIAKKEKLEAHIADVCEKCKFQPEDVILIEEMDLLSAPCQQLEHYDNMLKDMGFNDISVNHLGFSDGAIGYLPTDEKTINEVESRFESELIKLFDSYNLSLPKDSSCHLAYISSDLYVTGTQVFIANTLCETTDDERSATFIMSLRQLDPLKPDVISQHVTDILELKNNEFDYPSLFSKATIIVVNPDTGDIENRQEVMGTGTKEINIVITNKLPKNIYDDFLMLADTGMASGDQSFSEYISLKGKMPYYDMQSWKYPLVKSIRKLGGPDLISHIDSKIVGQVPFSGNKIFALTSNTTPKNTSPEQLTAIDELNKKLFSHTATAHISDLIRSRIEKSSTGEI